MKIHIVQRGDTLWDIAKQYNVDFEQLKQANPQISSPDMIMPGMKIMIPTGSKKIVHKSKEKQKTKDKQQPTKPLNMKEDDHKKKNELQMTVPDLGYMQLPVIPEASTQEKPTDDSQKESIKQQLHEKKSTQPAPKQPQVNYETPKHQFQPTIHHCCCCHCMHHQMHHMHQCHHRYMYVPPEGYPMRSVEPQYVGHLHGIYEFSSGHENYVENDQNTFNDEMRAYPTHYHQLQNVANPTPPNYVETEINPETTD